MGGGTKICRYRDTVVFQCPPNRPRTSYPRTGALYLGDGNLEPLVRLPESLCGLRFCVLSYGYKQVHCRTGILVQCFGLRRTGTRSSVTGRASYLTTLP